MKRRTFNACICYKTKRKLLLSLCCACSLCRCLLTHAFCSHPLSFLETIHFGLAASYCLLGRDKGYTHCRFGRMCVRNKFVHCFLFLPKSKPKSNPSKTKIPRLFLLKSKPKSNWITNWLQIKLIPNHFI